MLTGDRNLDMIILNKLNDKDLVNICRVNKLADKICKDQTFWLNRILIKFPYLNMDILNKYKRNRSWSQYYINDLRKINKDNAEYSLFYEAQIDRLDRVIISLRMGADIHFANDAAIRYASLKGNIDIVKYLVEAGANIHAQNDQAIRNASEKGHIDTVRYLVEMGSNIHARNDAAIKMASNNGHIEVVDYLKSLP